MRYWACPAFTSILLVSALEGGEFMRRVWNTFIRGLAAVLPVAVTIYLVVWLATTAEDMLGGALRLVLPDELYRPGLGLLAGFIVVMLAGLAVNAYVIRGFIRSGEAILARVPLVKTIYGALKDLTRFLPAGEERTDLKRVVIWRVASARVVGFVTAEHIHSRLCSDAPDRVAVYFPLSYQLGGHLLFVPRDELEATELTVEEAMRLVLIGGINSDKG
jgi:uncharacterized membrane protein